MSEQQAPQSSSNPCFSSWLRRTRHAWINGSGSDVPCGECNACCRSSYFIHIKPEESQTLEHINKKLLFPAPGLPKGNVLMGYFENGLCPMLIHERCSIYEYRPQTCRVYDCRIFAATGICAGDEDKALINQRVKQWEFNYPTQGDRNLHLAVKTAAQFLQTHASAFPQGVVPVNPSRLALLAIKVYDVFMDYMDASGHIRHLPAETELVRAILAAEGKFDTCRKSRRHE